MNSFIDQFSNLVFLFRRGVPAFRVDLIDVPLVIRRGRDIEFRSWARVTLEGPVVLRVACGRVGRRRGATGRTHGRFRPRVESHALLRDVHVLQLFGGFLKEIDFYLFTPLEPPFRGGNSSADTRCLFSVGKYFISNAPSTFSKYIFRHGEVEVCVKFFRDISKIWKEDFSTMGKNRRERKKFATRFYGRYFGDVGKKEKEGNDEYSKS